ncbi:MAG: hypothetical protein IPM98_16270 [Lewinellaceae bacterium]|nr:hypothetical protein [Lewinellaceae bacterium]
MAKSKGKPTPQIKRTVPADKPVTAKKQPASAPRTATFAPGFLEQHWLPALLLMSLSFVLYGAALQYGYILDDQMVFWQNAYVQKGFAGIGDIFGYDSFMGYFQKRENLLLLEGGRYRPLSLATFAAEVGIFGKDQPGISHFINILLYGITGVVLYRVLLGFFPLGEGGRWYFSAAFIGALIFVVHPLHSEAVANIKGRDEILALLFSLGALYAALKYFDTNGRLWYWLSGLLLLLGLFAKENALTFLAVIPLTVWFFAKVPTGRIAAASLPLFIAALVFILVRYKALGFMLDHGNAIGDLMNNPFLGMTGGEKLATTFLTLGWYVKLLVWPHPLTHDYYPYHVPKVDWADWRALASVALYIGMGVWATMNLRSRRVPAYAIAYWLVTLSIVSNLFVSVGTFMNERFAFMPSVAFGLLVGWLLAEKAPVWFKEQTNRPYLLGVGVLAIVVGVFGWLTIRRVPVWKDAMALNQSSIVTSPNSARSHCFYVTALYENVYLKTKDPELKKRMVDTMEYHINRSVEINPNYGSALVMKGAIAAARFEQDKQMDKLFHEFGILLEKIPNNSNFRPFFDEYMKYLATSGGNPNKINAFCYRMGYEYFFQEKQDLKNAVAVLEHGLPTLVENERVLNALSEVYTAAGNPQKAAEMKARAEASAQVLYR